MSKRSVMSRKAFHIALDFDVHAVTCPGVWLCPKGMIMLRVTMLGTTEYTKRLEPVFPLLFHERFHFQKTFAEVSCLSDLTEALKRTNIQIELLQIQENRCKGKLLASFSRSMVDVLSPSPADKGLVAGVDVDLLMEGTDCFPGILAPKVEVSTRVVIEEVINCPVYESWVINPITVSSYKSPEDKITKGKIITERKSPVRQKRVCHRKRKPKCICCKPNIGKTTEKAKIQNSGLVQKDICKDKSGGGNKCYCCQRCGKELDIENHGKVLMRERVTEEKDKHDNMFYSNPIRQSKSSCDCHLCHKYNHVFSCTCNSAKDTRLSELSPRGTPRLTSPVLPHRKVNSWCCRIPSACYETRKRSPSRIQHCFCKDSVKCCCKAYSLKKESESWCGKTLHLLDPDESDTPSKQKDSLNSYRQLFYKNLDSYYRKLNERICKKNNQENSHCIH